MTYKNDIKPNTYEIEGASANVPIKYDPSKIKTTNLLSQVTIHTAMNIKVFPMEDGKINRIKIEK